MKEYIEKCLRRPIVIKKNNEILKLLPLKYGGLYDIFNVYQDKIEWMIVRPRVDVRLNALRYDRNQIEKVSKLNCALYFNKLNYYAKEVMQNEGIPFVVANKQMFLPFLGMLLSEKNDRKIAPVRTISFLTQKLLLCAIYENWIDMNVTKIADRLGVSKMSVSRCLDEIEYFDLDILDFSGKTRKISIRNTMESIWEDLKPILRSPVITRFQLSEDIHLKNKAGISALCEYSLLSDKEYPTYAITKKELKDVQIKSFRQISRGEEIGCEVLELGYFIDFKGKNIQDPLSVVLSLTEEDVEDERVQLCIDEMLEDYVW